MTFDLALAWENMPALMAGAWTTLLVTVTVMAVGGPLGLLVSFARMSRHRGLAFFGAAYVAVCRGAPSLILLYLIYNGLAQLDIVREGWLWLLFQHAFFCVVVAFSLNHSGYVVEIMRGGMEAVPAGLIEAAAALGLSPRQVLWQIRLPIAVRYGLKAYQTESLIFMKSTAAVSAVTLTDLTAAANEIFYLTYDPFTPILAAGFIYWVINNAMRLGFGWLDRRLNRHLAPA
ncbi:ABC transporter permease [Zavarzinia compransoris]|uniref:Arginine transporter n=1 Tax=Zavarzinia compransoris TaxID=1264899 RepID=A0A317E3V6_9PROT|nr:ABC transporter permease subunit [Zavarzinia compransoris]PWR21717.1 arginine transporter [Zavarzinia compransoris]TDP45495.1 polar amino acid transport system permease protein/arginine/ornithine transport system permease protein [Zavarzinia compransoris]